VIALAHRKRMVALLFTAPPHIIHPNLGLVSNPSSSIRQTTPAVDEADLTMLERSAERRNPSFHAVFCDFEAEFCPARLQSFRSRR